MKNFAILILLVFGLGISVSKAQNSDIRRTYKWYFGNKAGIDFSSGTPVPITNSAMMAYEGCASISDTCGNLLFYTNGDTIWNAINQPMANGTGLMGCWSSTQTALIIPQPGNDSLYYLFTVDCGENAGANGLRYNRINMNLNGGLGDVIEKNVLVVAPVMEKLAATYHANGSDVWVVCTNRYPTGPPPDTTYNYQAFLLTEIGLNFSPILSSSLIHPHKNEDCQMKISHNGTKVANAWHGGNGWFKDTLEILDFDNTTGQLSNPFTLVADTAVSGYGVAFSPDDSKLYHTVLNFFNFPPHAIYKIFQYDINGIDSTSIANSKYLVHEDGTMNNTWSNFWSMENSPDGHILLTKIFSVNPPTRDSMDGIMNPNALGALCLFQKNAVCNGATHSNTIYASIVNLFSSYSGSPWIDSCQYDGIRKNQNSDAKFLIFPNPAFENFTIQVSENSVTSNFAIRIYNMIGEEVHFSTMQSPSKIIKRDRWPSGIYFITISTPDQMFTQKLIFY